MASGPEDLARRVRRAVRDERVLAAMRDVPRDAFVPAALRGAAWEDEALPLGAGQTISQPSLVARMCELLELSGTEAVLDVGTGSGYHAAVLGRLAAHVISVERHASLSRAAGDNLRAAGCANVTLLVGDGAAGHPAAAPYDAINVAAASSDGVRATLEGQLVDGGRLVIPTGADTGQRLVRVRRAGDGFERRDCGRVRFVPLVAGAPEDVSSRR